ncbi:hypothetical protein [Kutzneria sp. NPDC052558]|uniref:hypothetical protein n=1 Tax=Kutzneria sp. NPDC052558 TaxID=3364121 RepID=UPI0037C96C82
MPDSVKYWAAAVAAMLSLSGVVVVGAPAATASPTTATPTSVIPLNPCAHPGWREDTPTSGSLIGEPTNMRSGPYLDCAINHVGHSGDSAIFECYVVGGVYNGVSTWTFVYADGSRGWVNDSLLSGGGSSNHC